MILQEKDIIYHFKVVCNKILKDYTATKTIDSMFVGQVRAYVTILNDKDLEEIFNKEGAITLSKKFLEKYN